jgi:N-acetyl sugar amidotransferase
MKYCVSCLQPDTRPNIRFNAAGVCPACEYANTLNEVDWEERGKILQDIVAFGRQNNLSGYDCIIGVSGGKDSTRQAVFVREVLGMKPLLVSLNYPPEQVTERGVFNISNMINLGFDCINISPSPPVWRKLMRQAFLEHGNWARSTEAALFSSVPRLAIAYQIPLIWWGENPALQLGELNAKGKTGYDGNNLKRTNTLGGGDISWMLTDGIERRHLLQYTYPSDAEMERAGLRIIFLGYFWKDWSLIDNGNFSVLRGLDPRLDKPDRTGDAVGVSALDEDWVIVNQMIKYLKFGFGKVSEYVNEDIRLGRISRAEAIHLVEQYDGRCDPAYIADFAAYLEISVEKFWTVVDRFVSARLFEKKTLGVYVPRFKVGVGL